MIRLVRNVVTGHLQAVLEAPADPRSAVPTSWSFSRFLANVIELVETLGMVTQMIVTLREQLMATLPDFGRHLVDDGKAFESHSTGRVSRTTGLSSDPDADLGKHESGGVDAHTGKAWNKVCSDARSSGRANIWVIAERSPGSTWNSEN